MSGQEWVAIAAVAVAALYLIRRGIASIRGKRGSCGDCGSCASGPENDRMPVRKELYSLGGAKPKD
jgi:FeoB-associated Cys-rich membrane protein